MYLPGDDIRSIDWRVTARTGRLHTKLFHEERDRPALFVVDLGEQMRFGTRRAFMSVVAAETASLRAPARYPRRRRPARHQRRLMEDLRRRIDELAARECLPWQHDGNRVRISLSAKRAIADRAPRSTERPLRSSLPSSRHASAVNEDRRSLAFRIWRRNADVGREGAGTLRLL